MNAQTKEDTGTTIILPPEKKEKQLPGTTGNSEMATTGNPNQLIELAINKNLDMDKLERLMKMREEWLKQQASEAFFRSFSLFQSECPILKKDKQVRFQTKNNGVMEYWYTPLDKIVVAIAPLLTKNELSYRWEIDENKAGEIVEIIVTCIVTHSLGHSIKVTLSGWPDTTGLKNQNQEKTSTVTFLKRTTLTSALGIATADPDIDGVIPGKFDEPHASNNSHGNGKLATSNQLKMIKGLLEKNAITEKELCDHFHIDSVESIKKTSVNDVLSWIRNPA